MTNSFFSFTMSDRNAEHSTVRVRGAEMTALNFDDVTTDMETIRDAVDAVTRGLIYNEVWGNQNQTFPSNQPSNDNDAHRELKWLVAYHDTVTFKNYVMEIPCADVSFLRAGEDVFDPTLPEYTALVGALESFHLSVALNPIAVDGITMVGRNT